MMENPLLREGFLATHGLRWGELYFLIGVNFILAYLTFLRARENKMKTAGWVIFVFITTIVGYVIFIYFMHRQAKWVAGARGRENATEKAAREPDPFFRDELMDRLIDEGKFIKARKHLEEMIKMAREIGDEDGIRNYKSYELKIKEAAMR